MVQLEFKFSLANGTCFECNKVAEVFNHHIIPESLGGTKTVPLCACCHGKIHDIKFLTTSELTKRGLARAKERGIKLGKPSKIPEEVIKRICNLRRQKQTIRAIALECKITPSVVHRIVTKHLLVLGNPNPAHALEMAMRRNTELADNFATAIQETIQEIQKVGMTSLREIAHCLNIRGFKTRNGKAFHPQTVKNILAR